MSGQVGLEQRCAGHTEIWGPVMTRLNRAERSRVAASGPALASALFLLGGCAAPTSIISSANPSRAPASAWADYETLPVELHGVVPGYSKPELASLFPAYHPPQYASLGDLPAAHLPRRMVLYVNPAVVPSQATMCDGPAHIQRARQSGGSATVVGALCDGTKLISTATADIRTAGNDLSGIGYNFRIIRDQLYQSLFPGANDPNRFFQGY